MTKHKSKDQSFKPTRREFAKSLAAAAAMPLAAKAGSAPEAAAATVQQAPAQANPFTPQAEALTDVVRRRYPERLTGEQLEAVKRSIERALRGGDALRKFDLNNGDEPAFAFSADLPESLASAPNPQASEHEGGETRERPKKRKPRRN